MKKIYALPLVALILFSCNNAETPKLNSPNDSVAHVMTPLPDDDTLRVSGPMILFTQPDSAQIAHMMIADSEAFYIAADDYSFYNSHLMYKADSLGIKNISSDQPYLDFHLPEGKHEIIDRSADSLAWGIYLFNGTEKPVPYTSIETNVNYLKSYFKK